MEIFDICLFSLDESPLKVIDFLDVAVCYSSRTTGDLNEGVQDVVRDNLKHLHEDSTLNVPYIHLCPLLQLYIIPLIPYIKGGMTPH